MSLLPDNDVLSVKGAVPGRGTLFAVYFFAVAKREKDVNPM